MSDTVITDVRSLPEISQLGLNDQNIVQINCQRSVNDTVSVNNAINNNFIQGTQDFMFSVANNQKWSPSRSFFRARASLQFNDDITLNNGNNWRQPKKADGVALAEGFMNNAYSNAYCYAASVDISSLTQFVGQANMVKNRLTKTKPWLDTIGFTHNLIPDIEDRILLTSSDANVGTQALTTTDTPTSLGFTIAATVAVNATGLITFSAVPTTANLFLAGDRVLVGGQILTISTYVPGAVTAQATATVTTVVAAATLALNGFSRVRFVQASQEDLGFSSVETIFQPPLGIFSTESAMPSGAYRISLMPKNDLNSCIETKNALSANQRVRVIIENLYFYMSVFRTEKSFDSGTYYLSLDEMNIQTKTVTQGDSQGNYNFTIPSSTIGISTFVQPISAGTYSPGQITKIIPSSLFKDASNSTNRLRSIQLTYSNTSKPVQNYDSNYNESGPGATLQYLTQRYIDTHMNTELYSLSCESLEDWLTRGVLNYWSWIRSSDDRSTELQMTEQFALVSSDNNQFCCAIYRNLIKITVENGYITNVVKLQM